MSAEMKPSIGRTVHFVDEIAQEHAAIICHVWSEQTVNLYVFPHYTDKSPRGFFTSVPFSEPPVIPPASLLVNTWHWPERL